MGGDAASLVLKIVAARYMLDVIARNEAMK
jgi:hypothetical protein